MIESVKYLSATKIFPVMVSGSFDLFKNYDKVIFIFQSVFGGDDVCLLQLPLPCINSSATRVYFGHERRLAEGIFVLTSQSVLDTEKTFEVMPRITWTMIQFL